MSEMLEFTTKAKGDGSGEDGEESAPPLFHFRLDGVEFSAVKPKDALIAQLAPVNARRTAPAMKIKLALDFLGDCVVEPGRAILESRLLDPADELDAEDVMPILQAMGDHWKAHRDQQKAAGKR